jgi:hypothetical protein
MRAMDAFNEPFWNLDQLLAWMISRAPEAVQFARIGNDPRDAKTLRQIRMFAELAARRTAKEGRNIKEELWAASGLDRSSYQETHSLHPSSPKERALRRFCEQLPLQTELLMEEALTRTGRARLMIRGLNLVEPEKLRSLLKEVLADNSVQQPPREVAVSIFPHHDYLLWLFRKGALEGKGYLPGELLSVEISPADWAGLEIAISEDTQRLGVWRIGRTVNVKRGLDIDSKAIQKRRIDRLLGREGLHPGVGDIENVRVQRDEIMKEFAANTPTRRDMVKRLSDDDIRTLIRAEAKKSGRRPPIRFWCNCAEMREGGVTKERFERVWRELYPYPERGRRPKA